MNSDNLQRKLAAKSPWLDGLLAKPAPEAVEEIYLRLFSRKPADNERQVALTHLGDKPDRARYEDLLWSLLNSAEFVLNH